MQGIPFDDLQLILRRDAQVSGREVEAHELKVTTHYFLGYLNQTFSSLNTDTTRRTVFRVYGDVIGDSRYDVTKISSADYFEILYRKSDRVLILPIATTEGCRIWRYDRPNLIAGCDLFFPSPVSPTRFRQLNTENLRRRQIGDVSGWQYAVTQLPLEQLRTFIDRRLWRQLPVKSMVTNLLDANTTLIFTTEAKSQAEWVQSCRAIRRDLRGLGVQVGPFDPRAASPLPGVSGTLLYMS